MSVALLHTTGAAAAGAGLNSMPVLDSSTDGHPIPRGSPQMCAENRGAQALPEPHSNIVDYPGQGSVQFFLFLSKICMLFSNT